MIAKHKRTIASQLSALEGQLRFHVSSLEDRYRNCSIVGQKHSAAQIRRLRRKIDCLKRFGKQSTHN